MWCLVKGLGGLHVEHLKGGLAGGYWEVLDILSWNKNIWLTNVGKYGLKANGEAKVVNRKNVQLSFLERETYHSNGIFTISRYIHCTSFLLEQFSFQPVLVSWQNLWKSWIFFQVAEFFEHQWDGVVALASQGVKFPEWSLLGGFAVTVEGRTLWFAWPTLDSRCP